MSIKDPVHVAIIPITHLETLQKTRKFQDTALTHAQGDNRGVLPKQLDKVDKQPLPKVKLPSIKKRVHLKMLYDTIPKAEEEPPCDICQAACCRVFIVDLLKDEYESGIFDPYVIKVTKEVSTQVHSSSILVGQMQELLTPALVTTAGKDRYVLEGQVGEPCRFLINNRCSIYEDRPYICRTYSCIGDTRITDEHRSGKHPMFSKFKE